MALVAGQAQLKAKMQAKGKLRPYYVVRKKLPDGSGMLEELPERAPGASPNDEAAGRGVLQGDPARVERLRQAAALADDGGRAQNVRTAV